MKHVKKIFVAAVMALVLTVSTVGMVADAVEPEFCSHYWTVDEYAGSKTTHRSSHTVNGKECHVVEYTEYYNIRCRACGLIVGERTEDREKHSISH